MSVPMESRPLASAFESPTFAEDSSFHIEQPVGSMSISPCGRDVVLASREGLHIIDLDSPYSPPRYLPHRTPWEVADVQWSPFAARDCWVASTSNQKALVWNLGMKSWQNPIEHVLHAHSRAITDINFSAHHPEAIATCAIDSFVHCWDLRTPLRPVISFSDWFAGATQVKWNRQDPHVIASSHDKFLRIWDDRMGAYPIKSIEAHSTKIYGVDWNRVRANAVITCSLDKTIKFWDYTAEGDVPESIIRTPFPVWRARHTPFGRGVLAMPQRGNSDLHLYGCGKEAGIYPDESLPLVHSFPGHKGQVREFLWRHRGGVSDGIDCREFQLVSWGTDKELRLHRADPDVLRRVEYEKGEPPASNLSFTRMGAAYKSFRDTKDDMSSEADAYDSYLRDGTGMNTASIQQPRDWAHTTGTDPRVGMQGRSNFRVDTNPILWMRGVKISGWDIETMGDEITHVGERFTKVAFEFVDIRQRQVTISLNGPWSADGASLFLKVDIKFPMDYPAHSMPSFDIQKTSGVTDELSVRLSADLCSIAEAYLSHKKGCLEGIVRYLLGENSLEESSAWILGGTGEAIKSPVGGDLEGGSSDEDEVGLSRSQELGMSSELLRPANPNVMVPVAKASGALWANDGRMVCLFPPKRDKSIAALENLGLKEVARLSRADKVFGGFGRLQTTSPGARTSTAPSAEDHISDDYDNSDTETTSSSGSSGTLSALHYRFPTPRMWRNGSSLWLHRPRSTDNSQLSTIGGMTARLSESPKNVISIHDFSDLLPSKRELARKYRISGKGTDVCAHNASVALDAGYEELAQIWGLVKLVLQNQEATHAALNTDLAGRTARKRPGRRDSAVDLTYDAKIQDKSMMHWASHSFGGRWLLPSLLGHFERIGDIQMVAMLSCVLHRPTCELSVLSEESKRESPTSKNSEYFFLLDGGDIQPRPHDTTPFASTSKETQPTSTAHGSGRSSAEFWRHTATPPCSTGTTPPQTSRQLVLSGEKKPVSQNVLIPGSYDRQSQPRSGSGLGSALATSLTRSFTFGPSSASPPASALNKKRSSGSSPPVGLDSSVWANAFVTKPISAVPEHLTSTTLTSRTHSDTESERLQGTRKCSARLKVTLKNQRAFNHDPIYDLEAHWMLKSYRSGYSNLLSVWGLPVQQSEVLKIGHHVSCPDNTPADLRRQRSLRVSFCPLSDQEGRTYARTGYGDDTQGLEIRQHCYGCGHPRQLLISRSREIDGSMKHSTRRNYGHAKCSECGPSQKLPTRLSCVVCGEIVERLLTPCLSCGHVCCFSCHKAWFWTSAVDSQSNDEFQVCPTGCGCPCPERAMSGPSTLFSNLAVPESDATRNSARLKGGSIAQRYGPTGAADDAEAIQHDTDPELRKVSPFASLAKGWGSGLGRGPRAVENSKLKRNTHRGGKSD